MHTQTHAYKHAAYIKQVVFLFFYRVCACVSLCVLCPGQNVRPLNKQEYVLDIATEAEEVDSNYSFWFRRVVWTQPLKFDNELCVSMHYNQVPETAALSRCC